MPDNETSTPDTAPDAEPTIDAGDSVELGEAGSNALVVERKARAKAEREAKALKARLDEIEASKLSESEKANRRAEEAEARAAAAEQRAERFRIATQFGMTDEEAEVLLTGPDADIMTRQAELFAAARKATKPNGVQAPSEGKVPAPPALNSDDLESALKQKLNIPS